MTRIIRAELQPLRAPPHHHRRARRRVAFAVVATLGGVLVAARWPGPPAARGGTTLAALAGAGGGTEAFAVGASFVGFLVFVTVHRARRRPSSRAARSARCCSAIRTACG